MRALSTRITNIQNELNPTPSVKPTRSNPKARTASKNLWITRTLRLFKGGPANTEVSFTSADVFKGIGVAGAYRVLGIKVWNFTKASTNTNYIYVKGFTALIEGDSESTNTLVGEDVGTANSLAGIWMNIPDLIASNLSASSGSTTGLFGVVGDPQGTTGTITDPQQYVCDLTVRFQQL